MPTATAEPTVAAAPAPAQERRPFPFTIGADPEYNATVGDRRINANQLLQTVFENKKYRQANMGYEIPPHGNLGWDGNAATGEIRPTYSNRVEDVAANVKALYQALTSLSPLLSLSTKSDHAPVGGHVHFGGLTREQMNNIDHVHRSMISFYLPVLLGEDPLNVRMRAMSYGGMMDYRTGSTYEFRVPTAEWQTTEKICRSVLAYLGVVMNEILNKPDNVAKFEALRIRNATQAAAMHEMVTSKLALASKGMLEETKRAVRTFELYKDYKEEVEYVLRPDKVLKDKRKANFDIAKGWGIRPNPKTSLRALLSENTLLEALEKGIEVEKFLGVVDVMPNNEMRVSEFANIIREKAASTGWQLTNTYFFFGIRKGVKSVIAMDGKMNVRAGAAAMKTEGDYETMKTVFRKMRGKVSGRADGKEEKIVLVGIPYEDRVKRDSKPLIRALFEIESGKAAKPAFAKAVPGTTTDIQAAYSAPDSTAAPIVAHQTNTANIEARAQEALESSLSPEAHRIAVASGDTGFKRDDIFGMADANVSWFMDAAKSAKQDVTPRNPQPECAAS